MLARCILKYFLRIIVHDIAFQMWVSGCSFITYRNPVDFWRMTLYPVVLINSLINSRLFFRFLDIFSVVFKLFQLSYFLTNLYTFFFSFIVLTRTLNTILNNGSDEIKNTSLVPNLEGGRFSISPLSIMGLRLRLLWFEGFEVSFFKLKKFFFYCFAENFYCFWKDVKFFSNASSTSFNMISFFFSSLDY